MTDYSQQHIAIAGYALENQAAAEWFASRGAQVTILDHNPNTSVPESFNSILGPEAIDNLEPYDLIIRTPGMHPKHLSHGGARVTTTTQLFLEAYRNQVIGVTGTKGKGTTTTLLTHMFEAANQSVKLGGNIGTPLMSMYDHIQPDDVVVLELSSFQLIDSSVSPYIACVLMIEDDHLEWHTNRNEYIDAKAQITTHQTEDDIFIYHPKSGMVQPIIEQSTAGYKQQFLSEETFQLKDDILFFFKHELMNRSEVLLRGDHNLENIAAAATCFWLASSLTVDQKLEVMRAAISSFQGLEHRLEYVGTVNGVEFFNDSFATNPTAAKAGLAAFTDRSVTIIAGGFDKQLDLAPLADDIASHAAHAVLIGDTSVAIANLLNERAFNDYVVFETGTMEEFVKSAIESTPSEGVVLLSPGCASFGLFNSYKQRGELFKQTVHALTDE